MILDVQIYMLVRFLESQDEIFTIDHVLCIIVIFGRFPISKIHSISLFVIFRFEIQALIPLDFFQMVVFDILCGDVFPKDFGKCNTLDIEEFNILQSLSVENFRVILIWIFLSLLKP